MAIVHMLTKMNKNYHILLKEKNFQKEQKNKRVSYLRNAILYLK